jgi:protein involved in sex pheromone biosynthesis
VRHALVLLAAVLTAVALVLTACGSHPQGPAGRVVAKDKDHECHTTGTGKKRHQSCHWEYELTTRDKHGDTHEFEVSSSDYGDCRRGSAYPSCTHR